MNTRWFLFENRYLNDWLLEKPWPEELEQWKEHCPQPLNLEQLGEFVWDGGDNVVFLTLAEDKD